MLTPAPASTRPNSVASSRFKRGGERERERLNVDPVLRIVLCHCCPHLSPPRARYASKHTVPLPKSRTEHHAAAAAAVGTCSVLQARRYPQLPRDASGLASVCAAPSRPHDITWDSNFQWREDVAILNFGKYKGERHGFQGFGV